jgi:glyceraldehyde-3-phosphate dehydrogenase (NADP+)
MNTIPEEFQINTLLNQDTYLVDGELKKMDRSNHSSFFDNISTAEYAPTILGSVPLMGKLKLLRSFYQQAQHLIMVRDCGH